MNRADFICKKLYSARQQQLCAASLKCCTENITKLVEVVEGTMESFSDTTENHMMAWSLLL